MVVLDESKENFVMDVPLVEEVDALLRDEERKKTGRYLAVSVILFLVLLCLYQAISHGSSKVTALLTAAIIMFSYLLWLLYASHRRSEHLKINELGVDKQVSQVLETMNNIKSIQSSSGPNDNYVYSSSEDESERYPMENREKLNNQNVDRNKQNFDRRSSDYCNASFQADMVSSEKPTRKFSESNNMFIRTYSIA